jgi:PilZ domain-containing protein
MQERRSAERFRANLKVRWQSLMTQGRGAVCDLSASGCFVLTGGQVTPRELIRLELIAGDEVTTLWGQVAYHVNEMGFALRFVFGNEMDRRVLSSVIDVLPQN